MASSGVKNLAHLIGGWVVTLGLGVVLMTHFDEVRSAVGWKFEPKDFGVTAPREPEVRTVIKYVERPAEAAKEADAQASPQGKPISRSSEPLFSLSSELARQPDGHFHAEARINGSSVPVLVDTGATLVALTYEDARAAGLSVGRDEFRYWSETANGRARFARVTLDEVRIGNVAVRHVEAAVSEPGRLSQTLLGMSFLGQLRMEMRGGRLVLEQQ
jgi:aspartyl protease family protein